METAEQKFSGNNILFISAKLHFHMHLLKERLVESVIRGAVNTESTVVTNARHYTSLLEISKSVADIKQAMSENLPGDLITPDIRRCLHYLGEITGR